MEPQELLVLIKYKLKMTQQEFADKNGVSRVTVSNWVKGRHAIPRHIAEKYASYFTERHLIDD